MQPKEFFIEWMAGEIGITEATRIVDLGSGQSRNFIPLLQKFPNLAYVGVEPRVEDANVARELLKKFPNVRIYNQLAYDPLPDEAPFDVCVSLSVLEHVKDLERFIRNSTHLTKTGGTIMHRYDLGHALHPSSLKERLQVFVGNHFPLLLSEYTFVRYLNPDVVVALLKKNGATTNRITYHQMPNHKRFLKEFTPASPEEKRLCKELLAWECAISPHLSHMKQSVRESLFPAIAVWATKT